MKNLIILCLVFCSLSLFSQNLTGTWSCNDGATYSIRQNGNELWWFGDGAPQFRNVFHGKIHENLIYGDWSDVPGGDLRNSGSLTIKIVSNNVLELVWSSSGFGSNWTRGGTSAPEETKYNSPAGKWKTNIGELTLEVRGNRVIGTYEYKNGKLDGILTGNVMKGTWYQSNGSDEITITFNDSNTKFTSKYKQDGKWYSDWSGTRIK